MGPCDRRLQRSEFYRPEADGAHVAAGVRCTTKWSSASASRSSAVQGLSAGVRTWHLTYSADSAYCAARPHSHMSLCLQLLFYCYSATAYCTCIIHLFECLFMQVIVKSTKPLTSDRSLQLSGLAGFYTPSKVTLLILSDLENLFLFLFIFLFLVKPL